MMGGLDSVQMHVNYADTARSDKFKDIFEFIEGSEVRHMKVIKWHEEFVAVASYSSPIVVDKVKSLLISVANNKPIGIFLNLMTTHGVTPS